MARRTKLKTNADGSPPSANAGKMCRRWPSTELGLERAHLYKKLKVCGIER